MLVLSLSNVFVPKSNKIGLLYRLFNNVFRHVIEMYMFTLKDDDKRVAIVVHVQHRLMRHNIFQVH